MQRTDNDLAKIASDVHMQLDYDRRREKARTKTATLIKDAPPIITLDFWCRRCSIDFTGTGFKKITELIDELIAYYVGRCPKCRREAIRRITDKVNDEFYLRSKKVWSDRFRFAADTLQPNQWGFNTLYPQMFEKHLQEMIAKEDKVLEKHYDSSTRLARSKEFRRELEAADYRNET